MKTSLPSHTTFLIAPDSFKDALSSYDAAVAIQKGLQKRLPFCKTTLCPLTDGGEGFAEVMAFHFHLRRVEVQVCDPLFRKIPAVYFITADGKKAYIELAQAAGLQRLAPHERNPMVTSTFGVGEMIRDAIEKKVSHIVLGIGGSSTTDAGMGMAAALGWRFLNAAGEELRPVGENLLQITKISSPPIPPTLILDVLCDVTNPLAGTDGAAYTYARQKGANEVEIKKLNAGLSHFASLFSLSGDFAGAGAAGGVGFGAVVFLHAKIQSGIDSILKAIQFSKLAQAADFIITGEGRLDKQTQQGKLISGVIRYAGTKPVVAMCGKVSLNEAEIKKIGLLKAMQITQGEKTREALAATAQNLEAAAEKFAALGVKGNA